MDELVNSMKVSVANVFALYFKAQSYHWNVTGKDFPQLHDFFGDLYQELWESVDPLAEHIRTLDAYAPRSLERIAGLASIEMDMNIPKADQMISNLESANKRVIANLVEARNLADKYKKIGIVNFLEERIDIHEKHGWMLRSMMKV